MEKYYKILGLKPGATENEIKKAYRVLAMKYHPDKNPNNKEAEERFKEIAEAYDILLNPSKHKNKSTTTSNNTDGFSRGGEWFRRGWRADPENPNNKKQQGFNGADFARMYNDIFSERHKQYEQGFTMGDDVFGFDKQQHGGRTETDNNIYVDFKCSIKDLLSGVPLEHEVERKIICTNCDKGKPCVCSACAGAYPNKNKCTKCNGTGVEECACCGGKGYITIKKKIAITVNARKTPVKISKGDYTHYALLRFNGMGNQGVDFGGIVVNGDLYFRLHIDDVGKNVHFSGGDIIQNIGVSMAEAISGTKEFVAIDGRQYNITMRRINEFGVSEFKIPGAGIVANLDGKIGDYVIHAHVQFPDFSKLNAEDKTKLIEILKKL